MNSAMTHKHLKNIISSHSSFKSDYYVLQTTLKTSDIKLIKKSALIVLSKLNNVLKAIKDLDDHYNLSIGLEKYFSEIIKTLRNIRHTTSISILLENIDIIKNLQAKVCFSLDSLSLSLSKLELEFEKNIFGRFFSTKIPIPRLMNLVFLSVDHL